MTAKESSLLDILFFCRLGGYMVQWQKTS